jgi:uncharacterized membrane protein
MLKYILIATLPLTLLMVNVFAVLYDTDYLLDKSSGSAALPVIEYVQGTGSLPAFTQPEISHLEDVRALVFAAGFLSALLIAFQAVLFTFLWNTKRHEFVLLVENIVKSSSFITLLVVVTLAVFLANFSHAFQSFHELFFAAGTYAFPASSVLITSFPESFFQQTAVHVVASTALQALVLLILTWCDATMNASLFAQLPEKS